MRDKQRNFPYTTVPKVTGLLHDAVLTAEKGACSCPFDCLLLDAC